MSGFYRRDFHFYILIQMLLQSVQTVRIGTGNGFVPCMPFLAVGFRFVTIYKLYENSEQKSRQYSAESSRAGNLEILTWWLNSFGCPGPLLLTQFNFNTSMNKWSHAQ